MKRRRSWRRKKPLRLSNGPRFKVTITKVVERTPSRERRISKSRSSNRRRKMRKLSNMILVSAISHCHTQSKDL